MNLLEAERGVRDLVEVVVPEWQPFVGVHQVEEGFVCRVTVPGLRDVLEHPVVADDFAVGQPDVLKGWLIEQRRMVADLDALYPPKEESQPPAAPKAKKGKSK